MISRSRESNVSMTLFEIDIDIDEQRACPIELVQDHAGYTGLCTAWDACS
jgi:hypothetical protein